MNQQPLINGVRYSWGSIEINLFGRIVTGIVAISYKTAKEKEDFYGTGNNPVHRGRGNKKAESSLTLYKYEIDAIKRSLPRGKDLTDIAPFDISVNFVDGGERMEDVIHNCEFLEDNFDGKQGDKKLEIVCPLITSHITYNK